MKNAIKIFGIIAIVAVIGLSFVACSDDSGGGIPGDLVAKWYADEGTTTEAFEITAAGKFKASGAEWDISVSGSNLTLKTSGAEVGKCTYKVEGKKLTISQASGTFVAYSTYSPLYKK